MNDAYPYHVQPRLFEARKLYRPEPLSTPKQLVDLVRETLEDAEQEHLLVVCLTTKASLVTVECVSKGTVDCTMMHPPLRAITWLFVIFRTAIRENAHAIAVAHNHPPATRNRREKTSPTRTGSSGRDACSTSPSSIT